MCMGADSKGRLHIYSATNYSGAANKRVVIFCEDTRVLNFEVGAGSHRWVVGEKRTIKLKFYMHTIRKLWWPSHSRETRKKNKRIMSFIHTSTCMCNHTFLVHFSSSIIRWVGQAMFCILARVSQAKIPMVIPNKPDMLWKHCHQKGTIKDSLHLNLAKLPWYCSQVSDLTSKDIRTVDKAFDWLIENLGTVN